VIIELASEKRLSCKISGQYRDYQKLTNKTSIYDKIAKNGRNTIYEKLDKFADVKFKYSGLNKLAPNNIYNEITKCYCISYEGTKSDRYPRGLIINYKGERYGD
jgi:hypothetical protein